MLVSTVDKAAPSATEHAHLDVTSERAPSSQQQCHLSASFCVPGCATSTACCSGPCIRPGLIIGSEAVYLMPPFGRRKQHALTLPRSDVGSYRRCCLKCHSSCCRFPSTVTGRSGLTHRREMIFGFQSTSRSRLTRPNRQRLSHAERSPHIECTVYDHAEAMLQQLLPAVAWCLSCTPRQNVNSDLALRFSLSTSCSHRHCVTAYRAGASE